MKEGERGNEGREGGKMADREGEGERWLRQGELRERGLKQGKEKGAKERERA